jgi:hypothetical protein
MLSVFLSHSSKNKVFVRRLAASLTAAGIHPWVDEAELGVGDSLVDGLADAVLGCSFVAAVVSRDSIDSNWVKYEIGLAMTQEIEGRRVCVLPLKLDDVVLPNTIMHKLFLDFSNPDDFDSNVARIVQAVRRSETPRGVGSSADGIPQAPRPYTENRQGHMLERLRLDSQDFKRGDVVEPRFAATVADALAANRNIAVEGVPGSGKSGFAAYVAWLLEQLGRRIFSFEGYRLQSQNLVDIAKTVLTVAPDHVLVFDDLHLVPNLLPELLHEYPQSARGTYLLLARAPFMSKAARRGNIPHLAEPIHEITEGDSALIAQGLVRRWISVATQQAALLSRTRADLVLTKWMLEAVVLHGANVNAEPVNTAAEFLEGFRESYGDETLRLFLTLAAFSWMELPCDEKQLLHVMGFDTETLRRLEGAQELTATDDNPPNRSLSIKRHPSVCELLLEAIPHLHSTYLETVLNRTCRALRVSQDQLEQYSFTAVVLGSAVSRNLARLADIEFRLIYRSRHKRRRDFVDMVKVTAELPPAKPESGDDRQIRLLKLAFAAANGERRLNGAYAGRRLLEKLQERFDIREIPTRPFEDKGYVLYQYAYLFRLANEGQLALERFAESARADDKWAETEGSPKHVAKAAMSRIAAAAYATDIAVFDGCEPGRLTPNTERLDAVVRDLGNELKVLFSALKLDLEGAQGMARNFVTNAQLHLAEAAGWLGMASVVTEHLSSVEVGLDVTGSIRRAMTLARATLAYAKGHPADVIKELDGQLQELVDEDTGERAGVVAVLLTLAHAELNQFNAAEAMRLWLLSNRCRVDAGNGPARAWAAATPAYSE